MKRLHFAVILAGCGNKDGSEIQESVLTLLAIDQAGHSYQCFAPNIEQQQALNFLTNQPLRESRNVLVESARIARSEIKSLADFDASIVDVLVIPGGKGVLLNFTTYIKDGLTASINEDVRRAITLMHDEGKPIGALCIAPVLLGLLVPQATITFGQDKQLNDAFHTKGVQTVDSTAEGIVVDQVNKLVTTPCYMVNATPALMYKGINQLINKLIEMV